MTAPDLFPEAHNDSSDLDRRYTLKSMRTFALEKTGIEKFDLDVAADFESHLAERYYCHPADAQPGTVMLSHEHPLSFRHLSSTGCDFEDAGPGKVCPKCGRRMPSGIDGLRQRWDGHVWCNPPFSDLKPWVDYAWLKCGAADVKTITMLLPANRTEQPFWQQGVEPFRDRGVIPVAGGRASLETCFTPGREQFGIPGNPERKNTKNSPPFGCVLLIWRNARYVAQNWSRP